MPEFKIVIALDDGCDRPVPVPGGSKWVLGTVLQILPSDQVFGWAEEAGFLIVRAKTKKIDSVRVLVAARKLGIHVGRFMDPVEKAKYLTNRDTINIEFKKKQESMGYKAAEEKYRKMFQDTGTKPDWSKLPDLDAAEMTFETPTWQWVKEPGPEIIEP